MTVAGHIRGKDGVYAALLLRVFCEMPTELDAKQVCKQVKDYFSI